MPFTQSEDPRNTVQNGLRRLCLLFEQIKNGKKRIDQLDDHGIIVSQNLAKEFEFSATIGFGASFFEQLHIPQNKRPRKLREMPGHIRARRHSTLQSRTDRHDYPNRLYKRFCESLGLGK